jgi:Fic family protein
MSFRPRFSYTESLMRDFGVIEAARAVIEVLPLPPDRIVRIRLEARERSTRNSTGIEGNTLEGREIGRAVVVAPAKPLNVMQQEVRNYWRALEWIEEQIETNRLPSEEFIRELHGIIIVRGQGRRGHLSEYRVRECPVVDTATQVIDYAPPSPADVPKLMSELVAWWREPATALLPGPIRAGLLAHRFVSIHPFGDGNGRTARALATAELWRSGYEMRGSRWDSLSTIMRGGMIPIIRRGSNSL